MNTEEVIGFWHAFALRQDFNDRIMERGKEIIRDDPAYWADQSMWRVYDQIIAERSAALRATARA